MIETDALRSPSIDTRDLSFDRGAHLLINKALSEIPVGERLCIRGYAPELSVHLRAWCRSQGHEVIWPGRDFTDDEHSTASPLVAWLIRGSAATGRWRGAQRAGAADPRVEGAIV